MIVENTVQRHSIQRMEDLLGSEVSIILAQILGKESLSYRGSKIGFMVDSVLEQKCTMGL